jgi:hypothetical protein
MSLSLYRLSNPCTLFFSLSVLSLPLFDPCLFSAVPSQYDRRAVVGAISESRNRLWRSLGVMKFVFRFRGLFYGGGWCGTRCLCIRLFVDNFVPGTWLCMHSISCELCSQASWFVCVCVSLALFSLVSSSLLLYIDLFAGSPPFGISALTPRLIRYHASPARYRNSLCCSLAWLN